MNDFNSQHAKDIVADNLNYYLQVNNKTQADIVRDCKINQSTLSDYFTAKKYPRPDKMQLLADYFGVRKSDLTEQKTPPTEAGGIKDKLSQMISRLTPEEAVKLLDYVQLLLKAREDAPK